MTPVDCLFLTPAGVPIVGALVEFQLKKSAFNDIETGVLMPRLVTAVTDDEGRCTVDLWYTDEVWYVTVEDPLSDTGLSYKFYVPQLDAGNASVRLQDIVVDGEISDTPYDEAAILAIQAAKANALAAQAGAQAAQAAAEAAAGQAEGVIEGLQDIVLGVTQVYDAVEILQIAAASSEENAAQSAYQASQSVLGIQDAVDSVAQNSADAVAGAEAAAASALSASQSKTETAADAVATAADRAAIVPLASQVIADAQTVAENKSLVLNAKDLVVTRADQVAIDAGNAAGSAGTATAQAGIATTGAATTTTKAAEALASAQAADAAKNTAVGAMEQVASDALAADVSAGVATTQAGVSTTQAGLSETARAAAVVAKNEAVTAKGLAETAATNAAQRLADIIVQTTTFGNGWTPVIVVATDGERRVHQITDWNGGAGVKPATGYLGSSGLVATAAEAVNVRGAAGASGEGSGAVSTVLGIAPIEGDVAFGISDVPGLEDALAAAGAVKTVAGITPESDGSIPAVSLASALAAYFDAGGTAESLVEALGESLSASAFTGSYDDLIDVPTAFTPSVHGHTIDQITNLTAALAAKAETSAMNAAFASHIAAADPHEQYVLEEVGKGLSSNDFTTLDKVKLDGIATGATANSTDEYLRSRDNHTGSQAISTITGLSEVLDTKATTTYVDGIQSVINGQLMITNNVISVDGVANSTVIPLTDEQAKSGRMVIVGTPQGSVMLSWPAGTKGAWVLENASTSSIALAFTGGTLFLAPYTVYFVLSTGAGAVYSSLSTYGMHLVAPTEGQVPIFNAAQQRWIAGPTSDQVTLLTNGFTFASVTAFGRYVGYTTASDSPSPFNQVYVSIDVTPFYVVNGRYRQQKVVFYTGNNPLKTATRWMIQSTDLASWTYGPWAYQENTGRVQDIYGGSFTSLCEAIHAAFTMIGTINDVSSTAVNTSSNSLDNYITKGRYQFPSPEVVTSSLPSSFTGKKWFLEVYALLNNVILQRISTQSGDGLSATRSRTAGVWSAWVHDGLSAPSRLEIATTTATTKVLDPATYDMFELTLGANTTLSLPHVPLEANEVITRVIMIRADASNAYTLTIQPAFNMTLKLVTEGGAVIAAPAPGKLVEIVATARRNTTSSNTIWFIRKGASDA